VRIARAMETGGRQGLKRIPGWKAGAGVVGPSGNHFTWPWERKGWEWVEEQLIKQAPVPGWREWLEGRRKRQQAAPQGVFAAQTTQMPWPGFEKTRDPAKGSITKKVSRSNKMIFFTAMVFIRFWVVFGPERVGP
jgi:hypothetical protein